MMTVSVAEIVVWNTGDGDCRASSSINLVDIKSSETDFGNGAPGMPDEMAAIRFH